jgi:hypothetical protein
MGLKKLVQMHIDMALMGKKTMQKVWVETAQRKIMVSGFITLR